MQVHIDRMDHFGNGIGNINGKIIFVKGALTGETVDVTITKDKKSFMEGTINTIIYKSSKRVEPFCKYFGVCGGCSLCHLNYENTLEYKKERVNNIYAMGEYFALMVNEKMYEAKAIILATGMEVGKTLEGEERLLGKGVGYCATCDAPLYRDKVVTVIGYNKEAEEEANYVSELASKVNYVAMYKDEYDLKDDIEVVVDRPLEILGDAKVNAVRFKDKEIESDGVFVLRDSISPGQLVPGLLMENGHIKVDRTMATNIPGCFAAGDCVGVPYQYIKSAGEGNIAALSAVKYLDGLGK